MKIPVSRYESATAEMMFSELPAFAFIHVVQIKLVGQAQTNLYPGGRIILKY
jgi:hypothetical protein